MAEKRSIVPSRRIAEAILWIRGHRVIVDEDLASLYAVETRVLIQAVKRNPARFPADFMFQLTTAEFTRLRSQFVISKGAAADDTDPTRSQKKGARCPAAKAAREPPAARSKARHPRAQVRCAVRHRVHRDPAADDRGGESEAADRLRSERLKPGPAPSRDLHRIPAANPQVRDACVTRAGDSRSRDGPSCRPEATDSR